MTSVIYLEDFCVYKVCRILPKLFLSPFYHLSDTLLWLAPALLFPLVSSSSALPSWTSKLNIGAVAKGKLHLYGCGCQEEDCAGENLEAWPKITLNHGEITQKGV